MRRQIILLGMMLAAIFTLTNCVKEIDNPVPESTTEVPFEIIASVAETKTVNDGLKTLWEQGDRISLFYAISGQTTYEKAGGYDDFIIEDVDECLIYLPFFFIIFKVSKSTGSNKLSINLKLGFISFNETTNNSESLFVIFI